MKNLSRLFILFIAAFVARAQAIDSAKAHYSAGTQNLLVEVYGWIHVFDPEAITSISDTILNDTVSVNIDFKPCSPWQTIVYFDTAFTLNLSAMQSGPKTLIIRSYLLADIDTICYYLPVTTIQDSSIIPFNIPIGLAEPNLANIACYPNPTKDLLQLELPNNMELNYTLYTATGVPVLHGTCVKPTTLDLTSLANGLYLLELRHGDEVTRERILKN